MSGAWDDEPSTTVGANTAIRSSPPPRPQSTQQQAAILQGLLGNTNLPGGSNGWEDQPIHDDDTSVQPVNELNAQMSALMSRGTFGTGGPKLKLMRRGLDDRPGQPPGSGQMGRDETPTVITQKTAEQREREYEETRAAIFGGQIDGFKRKPSPPASSTNKTTTNTVASNNSSTRIVKKGTPKPSTSPPITQGASDASDSQPSVPSVQPSAAAVAEVNAHHSKRSEKQQQLQNKHKHVGGAGATTQNHRIIEDLVQGGSAIEDLGEDGVIAIANSPTQTHQGVRAPQNDPDYNRRTRKQLFQPKAYTYAGGGGNGTYAVPVPYPSNAPLLSYPAAATPNYPAQSNFALGPHGNQIGFGRGRTVQSGVQVGAGTSALHATARAFVPGALAFVPSSATVSSVSSVPPPAVVPLPTPSIAPAPLYAIPNVFMGSGEVYRPQYENHYITKDYKAKAPQRSTSGNANISHTPSEASTTPTHIASMEPNPSTLTSPHVQDESDFPALGAASATSAPVPAGKWKR